MQVEILEYLKSDRDSVVKGRFDIKIIYAPEKWEVIRNLVHLKKDDGKEWINFPSTKRGEVYLVIFERPPETTKTLFTTALEALKSYLISIEPSALVENAPNEPEPTDMF